MTSACDVTLRMADRDYSYDPVGSGAPVNQQAHRMEQGQLWRQYLVGGVANIGAISTGLCLGWTSPVNVKLLDVTQSPLPEPITVNQGSWIGSLFTVGAIFGPFLGGYLAPRIGRKWSMISCSVPLLLGWILVAIARNVCLIYAGRIAWGIGAGMLFTISPMYCAEIATDDCRGALGSYLQVFVTIGFLVVYGIGPYISYGNVAFVGIAFVSAFVIGFVFMPDSPIYYLTKNDKESAARSLMVLRGRSRAGIEGELFKMEADLQVSMAKTAAIADIFRGSNFKAFYLSCALVFFQQLCGINAVLFNLNTIFDAGGSHVDSNIATIIVGAVQVVASLMTVFIVDRLGRKILLLISTTGTAISLALLGVYFILDENAVSVNLGFLPLLSMMLFIITYCWGLGPLPMAIMSEVLPVEVKAAAAPIVTGFSWVLTFLVTRYFEPVAAAVGMYTAFWVFGVSCALGFLFTLFVVPETKGKSFADIQEMLAGKYQHSSKQEKA